MIMLNDGTLPYQPSQVASARQRGRMQCRMPGSYCTVHNHTTHNQTTMHYRNRANRERGSTATLVLYSTLLYLGPLGHACGKSSSHLSCHSHLVQGSAKLEFETVAHDITNSIRISLGVSTYHLSCSLMQKDFKNLKEFQPRRRRPRLSFICAVTKRLSSIPSRSTPSTPITLPMA